MKSISTLLFLAVFSTWASQAAAAPISCGIYDTDDATANGATADNCDYVSGGVASTGDLINHVDSVWGAGGSFDYIGKYEDGSGTEAGNLAGFTLTAGSGSNGYLFSYTLTVPQSWVGTTVDWVLGIKQANDSFVSYLFEGVVLGIDGNFNNYWLNPQGKPVNDYSFAAGFIRTVTVPEPGTLALFGLGLAGLFVARRNRKA